MNQWIGDLINELIDQLISELTKTLHQLIQNFINQVNDQKMNYINVIDESIHELMYTSQEERVKR